MNRQQITDAFSTKLSTLPKKNSQDRGLATAATQTGLSTATLSQAINGKWDAISDNAWRTIAAWCEFEGRDWTVVETGNYKRITGILEDSQMHQEAYGIIGDAGCGKSQSFKYYTVNNHHAYHIQCNEFWNRKLFLSDLLKSMGIESAGMTAGEMMQTIIKEMKRKPNPILIMDEFDKLNDQNLAFFITIYNYIGDHSGLIVSATDHLVKRINRGINLNKKGYKEFFSRIGRKWLFLDKANSHDITQICQANGIADKSTINDIIKEVIAEYDGDLRRAERLVKKHKKLNLKKAA